ncbi:MAG: DUF2505 domain-containing protein [Oceanococcus sp.]
MQRFERSSLIPAPADTVVAAISTEDYLVYRYDEAGIQSFDLEIRQDNETRFESHVRRKTSTNKLPSFARKITGDTVTLIQHQFWNRQAQPYTGELRMELEGLPGHILTRLTLSDNGDGSSTLSGIGEVEARIPLLGGRIEKMMVGKVSEGFERSAVAIREYLAKA